MGYISYFMRLVIRDYGAPTVGSLIDDVMNILMEKNVYEDYQHRSLHEINDQLLHDITAIDTRRMWKWSVTVMMHSSSSSSLSSNKQLLFVNKES